MQSLCFFNKEGDSLNFRWLPSQERWEGELLFSENSNDIFKTIGLYVFEKIPSFEYENIGNLQLDKFQLFNEFKFNITGCTTSNMTQSVNNDSSFYSKWIHGNHFESKYPVGSEIYFNSNPFGFGSSNNTYTVVQTKKNAILILGGSDNRSFNTTYGSLIGMTSSYINMAISGLNSIGIYNYINSSFDSPLSSWSEQDFYSKYYVGKKLTLINTSKNDGVVTVNNTDITHRVYYKNTVPVTSITNSGIFIELVLNTDLPVVYSGNLSLSGYNIMFPGNIPNSTLDVLKPGVEFVIPDSILNSNTLVVNSIPSFVGSSTVTYYATQSQVMWNNRIFQCAIGYTWTATSSITPDNPTYWTQSTYLPVTTPLSSETIYNTEIHLTTNKIRYYQPFTQSGIITLASAAENYKSDMEYFNIDLYYEDYKLNADLVYPTLYADVNFYIDGGTISIGTTTAINEHNIGVSETLVPEVNENLNLNYNYNIVFTDLDSFGLKIKINDQVYQEEIDWVYVGLNPDISRTIDKTLRNWIIKWYVPLSTIGIITSLQYRDSIYYYNTLNIKTEYPNVPLRFLVEVGTTANYYIEHSDVVFNDMGTYLSININGTSYGQSVTSMTQSSFIPDIPTALINWVDTYSSILIEYGIYVSSALSMLIFNVKSQTFEDGGTPISYTINTGKSTLPGILQYVVTNKSGGKFGALIASNELTLPVGGTYSFIDYPFATGQIVSINNTVKPYDNQEYNIIHIGDRSYSGGYIDIVLSYQGPFWGTSDLRCDVGPFATIAYSSGFSATGCEPPFIPPVVPIGGGQFNLDFDEGFSLSYATTNLYSNSSLNIGDAGLVDIMHLQFTSCIYALGDFITIIDSNLNIVISQLSIPGGVSIMMLYNPINFYIYILTDIGLYIFDPVSNIFDTTKTILFGVSNPNRNMYITPSGDVYITDTTSSNNIYIWSYNNFTSISSYTINIGSPCYKLSFNNGDGDIYVTTIDAIVRISGSTHLVVDTYSIPGLLYNNIFYEPISSSIYVFDGLSLYRLFGGLWQVISSISTSSFNELLFDNTLGLIVISQGITASYVSLNLDGTLNSLFPTPNYGYMSISQRDGDVYIASQNSNQVIIMDTVNNTVKGTQNFDGIIKKIIYNPDRMTIVGIEPIHDSIIEVSVTLTSSIELNSSTYSTIGDGYGTLDPNYIPYDDVWLKTREYIRKPRENYNGDTQVQYVWKWENDQFPQMFLYDFSGSQLPITGSYAYVGEKPLNTIHLNYSPNKDITKITSPEFQQTIFNEVVETLDYIDSDTDISFIPEPMQSFIGFRSDDEGPMNSRLLLCKRENISFTITTNSSNMDIIQFTLIRDFKNGDYGVIALNLNSNSVFTGRGLNVGQLIEIFVSDVTNDRNKYLSFNNAKTFKIRNVYTKYIVVDFYQPSGGSLDIIVDEFTQIDDYPILGKTTYLQTQFVVLDKIIGRFNLFGQTEIEDIRYKIELSNVGHNVLPDDIYIFKPYDINEEGVDWGYMNRKRKEMLMVRHDIFPYVGSYKAIVNAINFFGYNDLQLYEYYRNINVNSPLFYTLFKVEIPDIFDNTVPGFTVNDFLKHTMPNPNYETTNLFNLTYLITDKDGNNVLSYSIQEVMIKLQGLKYWLQKNVIPITHKILDITGRADFVGVDTIVHRNHDVKILNIKQSMTPIDFKLTEAYLMPVNSGSTVYTCHIDFFSATSSISPDYFTIKIRTYKTYVEWNPFTTYNSGDVITYYGKVYESVINNNKILNPRKYETSPNWNMNTDYQLGQIISYNRYIYEYSGTQSSFQVFGTSSTINPNQDIILNNSLSKWVNITEWLDIDFAPVQTISEYRTGTYSFNFTIDSNIDPFVTIEVTSDNGYGQIYTSKKNYEIRGLNDLSGSVQYIDNIGPFQPIVPIITPIP